MTCRALSPISQVAVILSTMPRMLFNTTLIRPRCAVILIACLLAACAPSAVRTAESTATVFPLFSNPQVVATSAAGQDTFSDLPAEARASTRQGDPRPPAYWAVWNTCAADNRAALAAENGGRAAGWFLMDDLLADPGIQLGNYQVMTCEAGLSLLQGRTTAGEATDDPIYALASQLLAAELNLNVGAETCPIAEEAALGGHLVLSEAGFTGEGEYAGALTSESANAIPRLVELLSGYNRGELCR